MTNKEAIEYLKIMIKTCGNDTAGKLEKQACNVAINAIEELEAYKKIETIENCRIAVEKEKKLQALMLQGQEILENLEEYDE